MRKAYRSLYAMSGEKETVSPHGSAEQIAEVLRDPENVRLLNSSTVILTRSYLMLKNDFTTYLPLTEIVRAQVETHYSSRCSGIDIKATDTFRRTCVFDMGALPYVTDISAYRNEIAQTLKETLAAYAPDAKFLR